MAPSELLAVYEAWQEVNSGFFTIARALGLGNVLEEIRQAIVSDLSRAFFDLQKPGMEAAS